ncbi:NAD-dependent epimerase [Desulfuribacillus stibiiarsenatis]|uniref:NAD-dependent epimerase n=1 Tax=Desulfuribacillus stibiiarsenatis TaxID=1390249 RepID=A0A1E5L609_9FIRM|nr:NAD(P)-dependent oxidoreductase [Desulfuribacillus stibiiarsenatis]OEH85504.1 NAD-dependent epimerase [Desulfuribacillus stibiiarsenatis]
MNVIVFGGSGFLGSHVADALSDRGYQVAIFDLQASPFLRADQTMIIGNILDRAQVIEAIKGFDYVYNFAGLASLDDATTEPIKTVELNIMGNVHIMEASVFHQVKRFVYASSIYVYSQKGGFYRCSKQASELYIEEFNRKYNLNYTVLRYGTLYGTRADERNSIYKYLQQALLEKKLVCNNPEEMREYIHVKDAANLSVDILDDQFNNRHIILTGHNHMKVKEMMMIIKEILNDDVELNFSNTDNLGGDHYSYTPYSYSPKIGQKLLGNCYTDIGQGLLECLEDIDINLKRR